MSVDRRSQSSQPVASPICPSSVYSLTDLDMLERISAGTDAGFIYARDKHPNAVTLAEQIASLEAGLWGVVAASGMGALVAAVIALVKSGDRIVASDQLYGRSTQLLGQELSRFDVTTTWIDTSDLSAVDTALKTPSKFLIAETISNPMLRIADIPALAEIARKHHCRVLIDNTFATPALVKPLALGADLVVESLTKLMGGHSDITLGIVVGNDPELNTSVANVATIWGMPGSPFDCWLAQRSLPTLPLRVASACENAAKIADWLGANQQVARVIYPGLADHSDHELASRLMSAPPGNMITFELPGGRDAVNHFMQRCPGIPFCPSLGDTATTCSYPAGTSHRYVDAETKKRLGITDGMIRLSVGVEICETIIQRLSAGL